MGLCEKIQERIARLASAVAIIEVGGLTEVETMIERKHRVEEVALEAVNSARQEGISFRIISTSSCCKKINIEDVTHEQSVGVDVLGLPL